MTAVEPATDRGALVAGRHADPHSLLGVHAADGGSVVRVLRPDATAVAVLPAGGGRFPLRPNGFEGLFEGTLPFPPRDYRLEVTGTRTEVVDDGYRLPPTVGELDLWLIAEGTHRRLWDVLGARTKSFDSEFGAVDGVSFAVLAPAARAVRVRGDFNGWDGRAHPMRRLDSGVWELFVPGARPGDRYRYEVLGADDRWREKADPMASATERPPANASVVFESRHHWTDDEFLARRTGRDWSREPLSVYEVHLGSWRAGLDYREAAHRLAEYATDLGFTHVQLMPVAEHPFGGSWGYQVTSHFAPTARFGDPDGFRYLVDHLHGAGIGVLLDFVPAHFPRDDWALGRFDGTALYEHPDPHRGEHPEWGTLIPDFGRPEVRGFLISAALHWLAEFHVDGLRVDAVSSMLYLDYSRGHGEWTPNVHGGKENLEAVALLRELTAEARRLAPGALVVAEESTAWPGVTAAGGLGFDLKWNMGWMNDVLRYVGHDPVHRAGRHGDLVFSFDYAWDEKHLLPLSHDEVVHGKGSLWGRQPGPESAKAAGLRALLAYTWAHPGKQLLFMGGEFGQVSEWDADGELSWELLDDPAHRGVQDLVRHLNRLHRTVPALHATDDDPRAFRLLVSEPAPNVVVFRRSGPGGAVVCAANFSGVPWRADATALPDARWTVLLTTDDPAFGGAGEGPRAGADVRPTEVELPALTVVLLIRPDHTENADLS
ncbi:MAG: 1,4-alpha-glucan branching protein GlgB [Umezawaea sp.]